MMIFRFRGRTLGGHVHVRVFAGVQDHSLGLAGTLIFRTEEWEELKLLTEQMPQINFQMLWESVLVTVDDDETEPHYRLPLDGPEFTD